MMGESGLLISGRYSAGSAWELEQGDGGESDGLRQLAAAAL